MSSEAPNTFFRFSDKLFVGFNDNPVFKEEFRLVRETPCGYWIEAVSKFFNFQDESRWVSKTARKRFAYPTQKEAIISYNARKRSQIMILEGQLKRAKENLKAGIKIAESIGASINKDGTKTLMEVFFGEQEREG